MNAPAWSFTLGREKPPHLRRSLIGLDVRLFRCSLSSQRSHLKRVVQKPQRSILRGGNLGRAVALHCTRQTLLQHAIHLMWPDVMIYNSACYLLGAKTAPVSPETAKAPCGTVCPESAHTLFVSEFMQKRWIIAAL